MDFFTPLPLPMPGPRFPTPAPPCSPVPSGRSFRSRQHAASAKRFPAPAKREGALPKPRRLFVFHSTNPNAQHWPCFWIRGPCLACPRFCHPSKQSQNPLPPITSMLLLVLPKMLPAVLELRFAPARATSPASGPPPAIGLGIAKKCRVPDFAMRRKKGPNDGIRKPHDAPRYL